MKTDLFESKDYLTYLKAIIEAKPKKGRGFRSSLAKAMNSPFSHVSQVLSGVSHLTLEQAEATNQHLGHTREEAEFFLLLVQLARAGTPALRARIQSQMQRLLEKRLVLKDRLSDFKKSVSREDQSVFYSSWHYGAVHILLTIPQFQTKEAITKHLGLSLKRVGEILEFLVSIGLAVQVHGHYKCGESIIHLGSDSPLITKHHVNWRVRAIESMDQESFAEDLHYSSVISVSQTDAHRIKSLLVKAIESARGIINPSKEEKLCCFCLDFFDL